jgi:hypothetical protein
MMNAVPADARGAAGGMIATFMNSASVLSIGIFFSLMVTGLASSLPHTMYAGLTAQGVPSASASAISHLPPIGVLFAAFLGYNPMQQLLGPAVLSHVPASHAAYLTGRQFFPSVITTPFHDGIGIAFGFAIACCVLGAVASALTGRAGLPKERESLGSQLAAMEGSRRAAADGLSGATEERGSERGKRPRVVPEATGGRAAEASGEEPSEIVIPNMVSDDTAAKS